jgi:hypothetical protein
MVRTQIQLTEQQAQYVRRMAAIQGISMAEYIRRSLDQTISSKPDAERKRRALAAIGCISSDTGDVSINHDKYLEEAYLK